MPGPCDSPVVSHNLRKFVSNYERTFKKMPISVIGHARNHQGLRPIWVQALRFFMSNNLTVQGLKIKDSPQFHFRFDGCQNVRVQSLTIKSPALSPNTDGIHVENTNNVGIYDSLISNGNYTTMIISRD